MKKSFRHKCWLSIPFVFLILCLTYFFWRFLPNQMIRGDGYVYLVQSFRDTYTSSLPVRLLSFDISPAILSWPLVKSFGLNISAYYNVALFFMLVINMAFYYLALIIFKNKFVATITTLIFATNYIGQWEMYASHMYAFFMERIPLMLLLIPSLIFLHLFLEKKQRKCYPISLALYFLGIGIAHWGVIFSAPYFLYPFFWYLFNNRKKIWLGVKVGLPYLLISGLFVGLQFWKYGGYGPSDWTFLGFLLHPAKYHYFADMLRQLVYWSEFPVILIGFKRFVGYLLDGQLVGPIYNGDPFSLLNVPNAKMITPWIISIYFLLSVYLYSRLPKFRTLLLTVIFGAGTIFFLNAYFGQYIIASQAGVNRYLYLPTYLLSLFWGLVFYGFFWRFNNRARKLFGILLLIIYLDMNYFLIDRTYAANADYLSPTKIIYTAIVHEFPRWKKGTVVVVSPLKYFGSYEVQFTNDQLGKGVVRFFDDDEFLNQKFDKKTKIVRMRYDLGCSCVLIR